MLPRELRLKLDRAVGDVAYAAVLFVVVFAVIAAVLELADPPPACRDVWAPTPVNDR